MGSNPIPSAISQLSPAPVRYGVEDVAISHRLGKLEIGEISLVVAVASPHRENAFEACKFSIDRIKQIVPIWKKEFFESGEVWVGSQEDLEAKAGGAIAGGGESS